MKKNYIDIHSHILPGIDDGSASMEESIAMLELAYEEGIRTIIATPHCGRRNYGFDPKTARGLVAALNVYIAERNAADGSLKGMRVVTGNEINYMSGVAFEAKTGDVFSLANSDYLLMEFYDNTDFATMEACMRELKMCSYKPVFAHIERYECLRDNPERIDALRSEGVLMQVNASELLEIPEELLVNENEADGTSADSAGEPSKNSKGLFRSGRRLVSRMRDTLVGGQMGVRDVMSTRSEAAWQYLLAGRVDLIASDAHGDIFRRPVMDSAIRAVRMVAGDETADRILANAEKILRNE